VKIRYTKTYTVKSLAHLHLVRSSFRNEPFLTLGFIQVDDEEENEALAEGGELCCWDSNVEFEDNHVVCYGSDGPSGGHHSVILYIPQEKIKSLIEVEEVQSDDDDH